jgi:hypothetical protein
MVNNPTNASAATEKSPLAERIAGENKGDCRHNR